MHTTIHAYMHTCMHCIRGIRGMCRMRRMCRMPCVHVYHECIAWRGIASYNISPHLIAWHRIHPYTHTPIHPYTHTPIHVHTHTHVDTHTHTHTHTYT